MIFDARCAGCGRRGPVICRTCRFSLAAPPGMPPTGDIIAAVPFAGRARDVLLGYKYGNRRQVAHHVAGLLVNRLLAAGLGPGRIDVVTWAPTSRRRRHRRGFDQAELVARRVAAQLGVPCRRLLERTSGDAQTGLDRVSRLHGPTFRGAPAARGRRVLVIDDVATTGATLRSAASALAAVGAADVRRAAVATTPSMTDSRRAPTGRAPTPPRTVVRGARAA